MAQAKKKTATRTAKKQSQCRQAHKKSVTRTTKQKSIPHEKFHVFVITAMSIIAGILLWADAAIMMVA